jgi:hypothetical protein
MISCSLEKRHDSPEKGPIDFEFQGKRNNQMFYSLSRSL